MLSFEQVQEALTKFADDLPWAIYKELNGGIVLLPDVMPHPESVNNDFYILGQYHCEPQRFGRYITIYYGSFCLVHGGLSDDAQRKKLKELLHHELTHHLEHLAGDRALEVRDAVDLERYQRRHRGANPQA